MHRDKYQIYMDPDKAAKKLGLSPMKTLDFQQADNISELLQQMSNTAFIGRAMIERGL